MKRKQLEKIIREYFPNEKIGWIERINDKYDHAELYLSCGGIVSMGIRPKGKGTTNFLHFNIIFSDIRLTDSNAYNGKINYFGDEPKEKLIEYLKELKEKAKTPEQKRIEVLELTIQNILDELNLIEKLSETEQNIYNLVNTALETN